MNRVLITLLGVGLILATADLLILVLSLILLILAGMLFGIFLHDITAWVARKVGGGYLVCFSICVAVLIALLLGGTLIMGSQIVQQASELGGALRSSGQDLQERLSEYPWMPDAENFQKVLTEKLGVLPPLSRGVQWLAWFVTAAFVIFFVGLYVAYDPELYEAGLTKLVPMHRRERARELLRAIHVALGRWMVGRLVSMSVIGISTAIGLWILGVPLPVTLGVIAAILTFIPNIGPILAAVPQTLLALQVDVQTAVYVIIFNLVLEGLESYLLTPVVQRYEVTLPPALTIAAQLILGAAIGVMGVMMAAPLTVVIMVVVQTLYVRDRLGDPDPGELAATGPGGGATISGPM